MNERRVSRPRRKSEQVIVVPIVETGLPGGMTMARGEAGGWIIRDSEGQVQGLGRDPEGAIFAVFKVGEVYGVLNGWNSFNRKREEGEGL